MWGCVCVLCAFSYMCERDTTGLPANWTDGVRLPQDDDDNGETLLTEDWLFPKTTGACFLQSSVEPGRRRKGHYSYSNWSYIEPPKLCYKSLAALQIRVVGLNLPGAVCFIEKDKNPHLFSVVFFKRNLFHFVFHSCSL